MKSKVIGINSLVLVLVAFSSLVSMFALTRIDNIVHQDLYRYGLTFSYEWAMPYWTMTTLVFAMGWFNIIIACAFQFYVLQFGRKKTEAMPQKEALKPETTYQPPIEEKEPRPQEIRPAEAETKETTAPPMEVQLEIRKEGEEAQEPAEESEEETVTVVETPQEYMETEQPEEDERQTPREEAEPTETMETEPEEPSPSLMESEEPQEDEGWREQETEPKEAVEIEPKPEEEFEEPQETVDVQLQEEMPRETVETETQEQPPLGSEIEAETTKREETQRQEDELTESYST